VIPSPVKALLGAGLSEGWRGSEEETEGLRRALGLVKNDQGPWKVLGGLTGAMRPKERIHLLLDLLPLGPEALLPLPDLLAQVQTLRSSQG